MRILEVIEFFTPEKGGSVESTRLLSRQFSTMGHSVTVCTSDFHHAELSQEGDFEVFAFKTRSSLGSFFFTPGLVPWARRHVKEFDVIHLNNFYSFQNAVVSHYAIKQGVPYVLSARGSAANNWGKKHLKNVYDLAVGNRLVRNASRLHALSKLEKDQYEARGAAPDKIRRIPNGIDLSQFQATSERGEFRRRHKISDQEKIVLFLGRLHPIKRIDLLIRAFCRLSLQMDRVRLAIVGPDDGCLSLLQKLADDLRLGEKVIFTGPLFDKDKVSAYVDSDLFVAPSEYEIFNRTIVEAWACGVPVLVVGWHGLLDWLDEAEAVTVDSDEAKLSAAMGNLLTNETERRRNADNGKRAVFNKFSIERVSLQFEELFQGCQRWAS